MLYDTLVPCSKRTGFQAIPNKSFRVDLKLIRDRLLSELSSKSFNLFANPMGFIAGTATLSAQYRLGDRVAIGATVGSWVCCHPTNQ